MATASERAGIEIAVPFYAAGTVAKGEFRCVECGYGAVTHAELPTCPMCRGELWEPVPWRPFTRGAPLRDEDGRFLSSLAL